MSPESDIAAGYECAYRILGAIRMMRQFGAEVRCDLPAHSDRAVIEECITQIQRLEVEASRHFNKLGDYLSRVYHRMPTCEYLEFGPQNSFSVFYNIITPILPGVCSWGIHVIKGTKPALGDVSPRIIGEKQLNYSQHRLMLEQSLLLGLLAEETEASVEIDSSEVKSGQTNADSNADKKRKFRPYVACISHVDPLIREIAHHLNRLQKIRGKNREIVAFSGTIRQFPCTIEEANNIVQAMSKYEREHNPNWH